MKRRFLVCREGLLRGDVSQYYRINNSDHWPIVIEVDVTTHAIINWEDILYLAFDRVNPGYRPQGSSYKYLIVPMDDAVIASLKPVRDYTVNIQAYA